MLNLDPKKLLQKALPHLIAIIALYAVAAAFYAPAILESKRLHQGDTLNFIGMSHETLSYEAVDGERPSWTDSMFGGMPTIQITGTGLMTFPKYVWALLRLLMSPEIMTLFIAMLSAYILSLCLKAPPLIAFIAGATFGLASINTLYLAAGHATKVRAISVMPGVLAGVIYAFRENKWMGAAIAAFFLSLHLDANHLQMTYYLIYLVVAVGLGELVYSYLKGELKTALTTSALLIAAAFSAALPSAPNLWLTQDYSHNTTRGAAILDADISEESGLDTDYILEYSLSKAEWLSMMVPNIKGGNDRLYWGEQRFSGGAFYFGAIAFALMLAFFFVSKDHIRWPLLVITLLAIILSWRDASWLTDLFLNHVPLFNKFRDTKMMLVLVQVIVAIGVSLSLKKIYDEAGGGNWKPWVISLSGVAGILGLFYLSPTSFFDFTSSIKPDLALEQLPRQQLINLRVELLRSDLLRSMGLIILASGGVFVVLKVMVKRKIVFLILALVMVFEIYQVDSRYPNNWVTEFEALYPFDPTPAEIEILKYESAGIEGFSEEVENHTSAIENELGHKLSRRHSRAQSAAQFNALNSLTHFRVIEWGNPFNDSRTSYFNKSIGGYHGAKLRRYQDFISHILNPEREQFAAAVQQTQNFEEASALLKGASMLNTKYLLAPGAAGPMPLGNALGSAWVVYDVHSVSSAHEELYAINEVDLSSTAIIHDEFSDLLRETTLQDSDSTSSYSAVLNNYHPEGSTYTVNSDKDGILMLSEIWYPEGWTATVNETEVPLLRANYILRALPIKAGLSEVELSFTPPGAERAGFVGGIGSILLLLFISLSMYMGCCGSQCCKLD